MDEQKFKLGDVVALTGRTRMRDDIAMRTVMRVTKRFVELNCGAKFSPCGSVTYPMDRSNHFGPWPRIAHWTEEHERMRDEILDAQAVSKLRDDLASARATRAQVAAARAALGLAPAAEEATR